MFSVVLSGYFAQVLPPSVVDARNPSSPAIHPWSADVKKTATRSPWTLAVCSTQPVWAFKVRQHVNRNSKTREMIFNLLSPKSLFCVFASLRLCVKKFLYEKGDPSQ